jgi:hypothetical protein
MKLQRTVIWIAGVFCAVGIGASQASAGDPGGNPGCTSLDNPAIIQIEVNALRAGGKTIVTSPNDTTKVTAKARIKKGTAFSGTTIVTVLLIQAVVDGIVVHEASQPGITLGVGKGGKGATLTLATESCGDNDFLDIVATFTGLDADNDLCVGKRVLKKACR